MKNLFRPFLIIIIFIALLSSCKKNANTNDPSALPDTLTTGWTKITSLPQVNLPDIFFPDNTNGFVISDDAIYKSSNSGVDWTKIYAVAGMINIGAANSNRACFVNGSSMPFTTLNGGTTFDSTFYGSGGTKFDDCFFTGPDTCYLSSGPYIWKSVNGGLLFDTLFNFHIDASFNSLFFLNNQQGWDLRPEGIYLTTDGSITWNLITPLSGVFGSIEFLDLNNGYYSNAGNVFKTINGGATWQSVYQSPDQNYFDIDFINVNEGYFADLHRIYKTSDAGSTWTPVVSLGSNVINEIHFTDANHGWACTTNGTVLKFNQ